MTKLIKFQASWCGPCRQLSNLMDTMTIGIPVEVVDIDTDTGSAVKFGIRSVPTLIIVDENSNPIRHKVGNCTKEQLVEFLGEFA
jgi:thioredoxin-like negative regulator of GroEL